MRGRIADLRAPRTIAIAVPLLILLSAMATAIGAQLLTQRTEAATAALRRTAAPAIAQQAQAATQADAIAARGAVLEGGTVVATLGAIATAVPPDARLALVSRDDAGQMRVEILLADPDLLKPAIRSAPVLRGLRQVDQRADPTGRMRIILQGTAR
jgi:hypothetical protein